MTPSPNPDTLILGCGYTGQRVARLLLAQGARVLATTRTPAHLAALASAGATVLPLDVADPDTLAALAAHISPGVRVLHSLPTIAGADPTPRLLAALGHRPARIVYISTTGVYGTAKEIDAMTPPALPPSERLRPRLEAENAVLASGIPALVLRPAGIYGPGQGVHASMRAGRYTLVGDGTNFLSRIHVDDLAAHCVAALASALTGAYPVADADPAPARVVAAFCAALLGLPMPPSVSPAQAHETLRADRRVDGSAIRTLLRLTLRYPSYTTGIPAAIAAESVL